MVKCKKLMIPHDNPARQVWDVFMGFVLLYVSLSLPLYMAFFPDGTAVSDFLDDFTDGLFMLDIPLNFVTTYCEEDGSVVTDFCQISINYIKGWFFIDLVSTVPLDSLFSMFPSDAAKLSKFAKVFRAFKFMKMARISKLGRLVPKIQSKFDIKNATISIIKFLTIILITAHWCACFFFLLARSGGFKPESFASVYVANSEGLPLHKRAPGSQYLSSIYWAFTIMSTVGFGDIMPGTFEERIFCSIMMFIGSAVFAYGICNMCTLVLNLNVEAAMFSELQDSTKSFLENKKIERKLRMGIKRYLLFRYYRSSINMFQSNTDESNELLRHVSGRLETCIAGELSRQLFWHCKYIQRYGNHFSRLISCSLVGHVYSPQELIMLKGSHHPNIFLISMGQVEYIFNTSIRLASDEYDQEDAKDVSLGKTLLGRVSRYSSSSRTVKSSQYDVGRSPMKKSNTSSIAYEKIDIESHVITLTSGSSFNEVAGLLNIPAFASAFSVSFADVYTISCDKYRSILEKLQQISANDKLWTQLEKELDERKKKIQNVKPEKKIAKCENEDCAMQCQTCQDEITIGDYTKPTTFFADPKKKANAQLEVVTEDIGKYTNNGFESSTNRKQKRTLGRTYKKKRQLIYRVTKNDEQKKNKNDEQKNQPNLQGLEKDVRKAIEELEKNILKHHKLLKELTKKKVKLEEAKSLPSTQIR